MFATIERWGRGLVALVALIALSACTIGREPAYDAVLAGEVTSLTAERRLLPHYHREYLERSLDGLRKAGLPE